ncbi:MAG: alpha/beta hydrolase [Mediterranea sp.]|jgi:acetyl esterase/lipase|nr:alpha/beta hydrolase [Mediterranea sp.]
MNRFLGLSVLALYAVSLSAQTPVRIWEGTKEKAKVELIPCIPSVGEAHTAVIICPGGSYFWLDRETEGTKVAEWLKRAGIAAFVLKYRTAGIAAFITHYRIASKGHQHPDMIRDIQRAIQLLRENAREYNINPERIGVMGFSAGGHLAMSSGVCFKTNFMAPLGIIPNVSLRPDFVAPVYPVVTLSDKRYVHKRSRRGLLGEWRKSNHKMRDSLSLEKQITVDCPPVFLMNCTDDPVVRYQNSVLLDSALTARRIPHKYIRYEKGGHGFGAAEDKSIPWEREFLDWLDTLF